MTNEPDDEGATCVHVDDGEILEVGPARTADGERRRVSGTLLPGLVDLQCNGAAGRGVDEGSAEALDAIAAGVWAGGAAAFLPTLITAPFEELLGRLEQVAAWIEARPTGGATPLGIHLEGPFLQAPGTHDADLFIDPTPARVDAILGAAAGHLSLITLAPDRPGAPEAIARLRAAGVAVALGHGEGVEQLEACISAGASMVTHLFNAMGPLHHRSPGFAGLALDDERLMCSLIPDGVHVHESMLRNAYRCLGPARTILVTDAVAAAAMPDGDYELAGAPVQLRDGVVRDQRGRLAGSVLTMAEAARRWTRMVPSTDACALAQLASTNPARVIGAASHGEIAAGRAARFCALAADGTVTAL